MNEIIVKSNLPEFTNKNLAKATQDIFKIGETVRRCALTTAVIIANVNDMECYKEDGFNNVHEWTEKTFGFKKSVSYSLLKIGNEYVREIKSPKTGKVVGYASNLLPEDSTKDFTTTQLEKMLPAGHPLALELVEGGKITPDMTCKEIGRIVKEATKGDTETPEDDTAETGHDTETPEDDTAEICIDLWDKEGKKYCVPLSIANNYMMD